MRGDVILYSISISSGLKIKNNNKIPTYHADSWAVSPLHASSCELCSADILFHAMMPGAKLHFAISQMEKLQFTKGSERVMRVHQ